MKNEPMEQLAEQSPPKAVLAESRRIRPILLIGLTVLVGGLLASFGLKRVIEWTPALSWFQEKQAFGWVPYVIAAGTAMVGLFCLGAVALALADRSVATPIEARLPRYGLRRLAGLLGIFVTRLSALSAAAAVVGVAFYYSIRYLKVLSGAPW